MYFKGADYPTESVVRKALQHIVQIQNDTAERIKVEAKFGAITAIYRKDHLPGLHRSTQQTNSYFLNSYIEPRFADEPLRNVTPMAVSQWLNSLHLEPTTKSGIRSVMKICFDLAALHEFVPATERNPMTLIRLRGTTKRLKKITKLTPKQFRDLLIALPEPLNVMTLITGSLGLRVSEMVALQWRDIDFKKKQIEIQRAFTHGALDESKTASSKATLPLADPLLAVLKQWWPRTEGSEWIFPSRRTGGVRSASGLLTEGQQPVAREIGIGHLTWHALRHACRSWLDSERTQPGVQKNLLRHSDVAMTFKYGGALSIDMRRVHNRLVKQLVPKKLSFKK
jgi:integrase